MFALLFDRRSLLVTSLSLAAVGVLLFAAGVVTGMTLRRERTLVPPHWLLHGPVETGDVRLGAPGRGPGAAALGAGGAGGAGADSAVDVGGAAAATGGATEPPPGADPDWVPFAAPGDPRPGEEASGVRATPPDAGATSGGAGSGGAKTEGAKMEDAKTGATPPAAAAGDTDSAEPVPGEVGGGGAAAAPSRRAIPLTPPDPAPEHRADLPAAGCHGPQGWYVQAGAFAVAANAHAQGAALEARFATAGYRSYLRPVTATSGRRLTLVRVGPFPSLGAARRTAAQLDGAIIGRERGDGGTDCREAGEARRTAPPVVTGETSEGEGTATDARTLALISPTGRERR